MDVDKLVAAPKQVIRSLQLVLKIPHQARMTRDPDRGHTTHPRNAGVQRIVLDTGRPQAVLLRKRGDLGLGRGPLGQQKVNRRLSAAAALVVERMRLQARVRPAQVGVQGIRGPLGIGLIGVFGQGQSPGHGSAVGKRINIGHGAAGIPAQAQDSLAPPAVAQGKADAVALVLGNGRAQHPTVVLILCLVLLPQERIAVDRPVPNRCGGKTGQENDRSRPDLNPPANGLKGGPPRKLFERVAKQQKVIGIALQGNSGSERDELAVDTQPGQAVEVRGVGGFERGFSAQHGLGSVGKAVENNEQDGDGCVGLRHKGDSAGAQPLPFFRLPQPVLGVYRLQDPGNCGRHTGFPALARPELAAHLAAADPFRRARVQDFHPPAGGLEALEFFAAPVRKQPDILHCFRRTVGSPALWMMNRKGHDRAARRRYSGLGQGRAHHPLTLKKAKRIGLRPVALGICGFYDTCRWIGVGNADDQMRTAGQGGQGVLQMARMKRLKPAVDHAVGRGHSSLPALKPSSSLPEE